MDELENLLRGEHEGHRDAAPEPEPEVLARVRGAARRRRMVRGVAASGLAVFAVGAVGVGVWGLGLTDRPNQLEPMESVEPSPVPTEAPTTAPTPAPQDALDVETDASPDPEVSDEPDGVGPPVDGSPDGIPEGQYPPLAADRGTFYAHETDEEVRYPTAHVIEDWVWDRVGSGWSIETVSTERDYYGTATQPAAVLYLVSPEDVYFDLGSPPEETWGDTRAVSWHERAHTVRLAWWTPQGEDAGGLYDLRTGELDKLQTNVFGKPATSHTFITGNAQGDELWWARSDAGAKLYRWNAKQGWHASAVVDEAPDADYLEVSPGFQTSTVSANGDRLLLSESPNLVDRSTLSFIDYQLSSDTVTRRSFELPPGIDTVQNFEFIDSNTVVSDAWGSGSEVDTSLKYSLTGNGTVTPAGDRSPAWRPVKKVIRYGEASPPNIGVMRCLC